MASKLTKAQRDHLVRIAAYELGAPYRVRAVANYSAPVRRLLRRGLIERRLHPNPKYRSTAALMFATTAGRAALALSKKDDTKQAGSYNPGAEDCTEVKPLARPMPLDAGEGER